VSCVAGVTWLGLGREGDEAGHGRINVAALAGSAREVTAMWCSAMGLAFAALLELALDPSIASTRPAAPAP